MTDRSTPTQAPDATLGRVSPEQYREALARFATGVTVTAPGFFGPSGRYLDGVTNSVADVKQRLGRIEVRGARVLNMEMESSLLFHLAAQLGVRAGTICPTISSPGSHGTVIDYDGRVGQAIDDRRVEPGAVARIGRLQSTPTAGMNLNAVEADVTPAAIAAAVWPWR